MTISMGPHSWHNRIITPQDAQKVRPARPQRVKARGVPSRHVEGLNDARTPLADFFSILLHRANRNEPLRLHAAEVGAHMATEYALRIEHNRPTRPSPKHHPMPARTIPLFVPFDARNARSGRASHEVKRTSVC